ncbi:hypothetical protein [Luteolibacter marinus]|uniref:hypothetical protein n=1 Tax=Luteolibacter marinus TaxID=2776705 RepID=UPI0018662345|nr:hypothetical protein [Luteolibacter marinus]
MKFAALLLMLANPLLAQSNASKLLEAGLLHAVEGFKPIPEADKKVVLNQTATLLSKHITFRPDGTASSTYNNGSPWPVEWRKLVVHRISRQLVTEADRLNGVTRRYLASLRCDAHRQWKPKTTAWTGWQPSGFLFFPSAIIIEEKNGNWSARGNAELPKFSPGPGPSIQDKPTAPVSPGLPPGMTRIPSSPAR